MRNLVFIIKKMLCKKIKNKWGQKRKIAFLRPNLGGQRSNDAIEPLGFAVLSGLTNRKTGKWEAFTKFEVTDKNKEILINECSKTCDECQFDWSN